MRDNASVRRIMRRARSQFCALSALLVRARLDRVRCWRRPTHRAASSILCCSIRRVSRAITFVSLPFHSAAISCFIADGSRRRIQFALTDVEFLHRRRRPYLHPFKLLQRKRERKRENSVPRTFSESFMRFNIKNIKELFITSILCIFQSDI